MKFVLTKGLTFYYNIKTHKSQWNFPKSESISTTQSADSTESELSSTTNNTFKVYKDQFREKLSKLVVNLLKPYLNEKCRFGHIRNTDDFKHLARKFTHTIIEKELSRATRLEELDLDNRVKAKSKEYISSYMAKFDTVAGYCRKQDV